MQQPVDLTNLRSMTDGDRELERALFIEFNSAFQDGIASLRKAIAANDTSGWHQHAHALKGIALNLGAVLLAALCKEAQEQTLNTKSSDLLDKIEAEFLVVKQFLLTA
jgi:HPt (histidine-containing phosphotransfer) domain-containing protein